MADSFVFQIDWTTAAIVIDRPGDVMWRGLFMGDETQITAMPERRFPPPWSVDPWLTLILVNAARPPIDT